MVQRIEVRIEWWQSDRRRRATVRISNVHCQPNGWGSDLCCPIKNVWNANATHELACTMPIITVSFLITRNWMVWCSFIAWWWYQGESLVRVKFESDFAFIFISNAVWTLNSLRIVEIYLNSIALVDSVGATDEDDRNARKCYSNYNFSVFIVVVALSWKYLL